MRALVASVLAVIALAACAGGMAGTSGPTWLKVTYWENGRDGSAPVVWTLRCDPPRGTHPRPALACRRLAAGGPKLFAPVPPSTACTMIYGGPQVARVVGSVQGTRIWTTLTRVDGCEIERWQRVSPWLLPPGGATR
ncbi:MAG: SSI family serine proteinase inhibitor [Thermoleophilia bacterium]|nr:SSI family serine proteinase inhibitor [Thermoleophilia bacterium]